LDESGAIVETRLLTGTGLTLGSAPVNDVILRSGRVSEKHARIDWDGTHVTVTDLGSSENTLLEGHRLLPQVAQPWVPEKWLKIRPYWIWLEHKLGPPTERKIIDVLLDHGGREMSLIPGKQAVCRVTLVNQKSQVDQASLTIEGMPEEWLEGDNRPIN